MKNIHPKYLLPLIIFPILVFLNFAFLGIFKGKKNEDLGLEKSEQLNSNLPDANVDDIVSDKFSSLANTFNMRRGDGYTNVAELDMEEEEEKIDLAEQYLSDNPNDLTKEQQRKVDSITDIVMYQGAVPKIENPFQQLKENNQNISSSKTEVVKEEENIWEKQAEEMKKIFEANSSNSNNDYQPDEEEMIANELMKKMLEKEEEQERREKEYQESLVEMEKVRKENQGFNTVRRVVDDNNLIKAIIDEDITAEDGSRIRLRVLEDIYIEGQLYPKNSTIYAQVTGFQAQRVEFMVTNVVLDGGIEKAEIDVYDVDGMRGLYVPKSSFRDFTKDIGAGAAQSSNVPTQDSQDQESQFLWGVFNNVFNTTTQAVANSARKNRAKIKYGTVVYLKNRK